jgi:hypothetical protein
VETDVYELSYAFNVERTTVGRVNSGGVFLYRRRLWTVLNPIQSVNGKLVRTLEGNSHQAKTMKSTTKVWLLTKGIYSGAPINESR